MSIDAVEAQLRSRLPDLAGMRNRVKFMLEGEGALYVDATQTPPVLSRSDAEADVAISMTSENMLKLLAGELNPTMAFTLGKLKIHGSMGQALKLASLLED